MARGGSYDAMSDKPPEKPEVMRHESDEARRRIIEEYAADRRGLIRKLRQKSKGADAAQGTSQMILNSTITCPKCGHAATEVMPTDACQFFYDCKGCGERLKPLPGDCCVFCPFGTVRCPPVQENSKGCCC